MTKAELDALVATFTAEKREKIARSPYAFFRGTAALFYETLFKEKLDHDRAQVLSNGDVHPLNFGIVPLSDEPLGDRVHVAMNDFDEACHAPYSVDVKRGATGFLLMARQQSLKERDCKDAVEAFVHGYVDEIKKLDEDDKRVHKQLTREHAEGEAKKLLDEAHRIGRRHFLDHYVDGEKFRVRDNVTPAPEMVKSMAPLIHDLGDGLAVRDVAHRLGSGTASAGLDRYFVLAAHGGHDVILEVKLAVSSTLRPFVGTAPLARTPGEAAARAQRQLSSSWARAIELQGKSYSVRERCPQKATIPDAGVSREGLVDWASTCGLLLARAHARSTEGAASAVRASLAAIKEKNGKGAFLDEVGELAIAAAALMERAHTALAKR